MVSENMCNMLYVYWFRVIKIRYVTKGNLTYSLPLSKVMELLEDSQKLMIREKCKPGRVPAVFSCCIVCES